MDSNQYLENLLKNNKVNNNYKRELLNRHKGKIK